MLFSQSNLALNVDRTYSLTDTQPVPTMTVMPERLVFRLPLAFLIVCLALLQTPSTSAQTWREVQSPHFRVVTDGSERDGRDVAKEFEQMRSVFALRFPNAALETGAPLLVVAVREPGLHALAPIFWKQRDRVAGEFFRGWERQYALVRLDTFGDLNQAIVFHEYAHSVLHANVHWLPRWLDEGLAEFYAYTRFQGDRIYVGAPSIRLRHLQSDPPLPMSEMMTANSRSFAKDERREDLFYGEAWAIVHYMTFGPEMGGGAKLNKFMAALEAGTPQVQAFQQVFGDSKTFEKQLSNYLSRFAMNAGVFPPVQGLDAKSFPAKVLTAAEANYELGSFDIGAHDHAAGKILLQAAESADPTLAGPHEELGFLAWREGKDEEARAEWQKAVSADPSSYRAAFALLMSGTPLKKQNAPQLIQTRTSLEAIKEKAPKFAPVLVELALIEWRLGEMNKAYQSALEAEKLEPWRAGYHLLTGYILLQGHQPKVAEGYARMVATRWYGSDHDEAVDLWNMLPPDTRGEGPALILALHADSTVVRGTIVSSSCDKTGLSLTLQPTTSNATPLKLVASGPHESGFSDTLWVGEDHYTTCFHLEGLPALVAYKVDPAGVEKITALEVRDDMLEVNLPKLAAATSSPSSSQ
jgi:tetratricopeptide (TPR) repeat protein